MSRFRQADAEPRRRDADDGEFSVADRQALAEHLRLAAEPALPERMAEHHHSAAAWAGLLRREHPPHDGRTPNAWNSSEVA